jgi:hypothetical protein
MAIQEYTEQINRVALTVTKCAIVLSDDNQIFDKTMGQVGEIVTTSKVVTGTLLQVEAYIKDNDLQYYVQPSFDDEE